MSNTRRVSIGFDGGQVLAARVGEKALAALRSALEKGGWHDLEAEDGSALVYVPKIVYITTDTSEHLVGFGAAAR
jgi:hypothetical protein